MIHIYIWGGDGGYPPYGGDRPQRGFILRLNVGY